MELSDSNIIWHYRDGLDRAVRIVERLESQQTRHNRKRAAWSKAIIDRIQAESRAVADIARASEVGHDPS